ncbi:uncharacterized protein [Asterias amurensis]|uniref:uncharacterized protein n=1 Tax=Asterias amurensis TaxID=7602 RepID=UPI003AB5DF5C
MTTDTKCTTSAEEQPAVSQITSEEEGAQPPQKERGPSMRVITCFLVILALPHFILGGVSAGAGIILFGRAPSTWLAYTVAPIWSGGCVVVCGAFGIASAKHKTAYSILCFTAASVVSVIVCCICIQLLRLGLVDHTTDGQTFIKETLDTTVMVALASAAVSCAFSTVSAITSSLIAWHLKKEEKIRGQRRVLNKEELIAERQKQLRQQKEQEKKVLDRMEKERNRAGRYHRI